MNQLSPWSSTSTSSCQSSVEIKEFFCDDDLIDSSNGTLGIHVTLRDASCQVLSRDTDDTRDMDNTLRAQHASTSVVNQPATLVLGNSTDSADKTLTTGTFAVTVMSACWLVLVDTGSLTLLEICWNYFYSRKSTQSPGNFLVKFPSLRVSLILVTLLVFQSVSVQNISR